MTEIKVRATIAVAGRGAPLTGAKKYVLHFDGHKIPPVSVCWNLSIYDEKEFFIESDFKRCTIGCTTDGLKRNPDGSIIILIQNGPPARPIGCRRRLAASTWQCIFTVHKRRSWTGPIDSLACETRTEDARSRLCGSGCC